MNKETKAPSKTYLVVVWLVVYFAVIAVFTVSLSIGLFFLRV